MGIKTSDSYQKEILARYKREKGGDMRGYLAEPTRRQIREACIALLGKRNLKHDERILNRFFQFEEGKNRILQIQHFKADKFVPIVKFLKEKVQRTSPENIELISWLIDFQPRPLQEYLKPDNSISEEEPERPEPEIVDEPNDEEERRRRKRIITISISLAFGITLMILGVQKWPSYFPKNNPKDVGCMTWADSLYVEVSCDEAPFSKYGTRVKPLDPMELKNMRKAEVHAAYKFFSKDDKPLIWYYKKSNKEIEYFTSPGLHPTNGETLRKITTHIIETYVPIHSNNKDSFLE